MTTTALEMAIEDVERSRAKYDAKLAEMTANPEKLYDALRWGVAGELAKLKVQAEAADLFLELTDDGRTPSEAATAVLDRATAMMLRGARWPSRSTSPYSNAMETDETAAWAELSAEGLYRFLAKQNDDS